MCKIVDHGEVIECKFLDSSFMRCTKQHKDIINFDFCEFFEVKQ